MALEPDRGSDALPAGAWLRQGRRFVCTSVEELGDLWPGARFESRVADFHAEALRLQFGDFRLETTHASGHRCTRDQSMIDMHPRRAISIDVVLEGRLRRRQQGMDCLQLPNTAAVTVLDEPFEIEWEGPGRSVRTVTAVSLLPVEFHRPQAIAAGLLRPSPLVSAYVAFVGSLVDVAEPIAATHRSLEMAALGLHRALLLEALTGGHDPQRALQRRIEEHIDQHLSDQGLSPTSIAKALFVSVRAVHGAFEDSNITVAAEIRRRRLLAAVLLMRVEFPPPRTVTALSVGFSSTDQLRRAFVAVLGVTPFEFLRRY